MLIPVPALFSRNREVEHKFLHWHIIHKYNLLCGCNNHWICPIYIIFYLRFHNLFLYKQVCLTRFTVTCSISLKEELFFPLTKMVISHFGISIQYNDRHRCRAFPVNYFPGFHLLFRWVAVYNISQLVGAINNVVA